MSSFVLKTGDVQIAMTAFEKTLLATYIEKSQFYFEYGCGGSTFLSCRVGPAIQKIVAIDSSQVWLDKVGNDSCISKPENRKRYKIKKGGPSDKVKLACHRLCKHY